MKLICAWCKLVLLEGELPARLKGFLDPTLEDGIPIAPPMSVITSSGRKPLPDSFSPSKFYHNYGRRLLIIGGPGGGKTIQLFKVADDLMPRGSAVDKRPIPMSAPV